MQILVKRKFSDFLKENSMQGMFFSEIPVNLQNLREVAKLAIPGIVMLCAEWWAFELLAVGAGWLGESQLSAQAVCLNTLALL